MVGQRDFVVSGPTTWSSLPVELWTLSLSSHSQMLEKNSKIIYSAASASEDFCLIDARYKYTYLFIDMHPCVYVCVCDISCGTEGTQYKGNCTPGLETTKHPSVVFTAIQKHQDQHYLHSVVRHHTKNR